MSEKYFWKNQKRFCGVLFFVWSQRTRKLLWEKYVLMIMLTKYNPIWTPWNTMRKMRTTFLTQFVIFRLLNVKLYDACCRDIKRWYNKIHYLWVEAVYGWANYLHLVSIQNAWWKSLKKRTSAYLCAREHSLYMLSTDWVHHCTSSFCNRLYCW